MVPRGQEQRTAKILKFLSWIERLSHTWRVRTFVFRLQWLMRWRDRIVGERQALRNDNEPGQDNQEFHQKTS
jgi:hypothetical protein